MRVGLIDVDGHVFEGRKFPNLALMKISAYEKSQGNNVEWWNGLMFYDRVYQAKVFDDTYTKDNEFVIQANEIIKGGTGYDLDNKLPDEIEHIYPDYSLYGIDDTAYGFLTRGCPRHCKFCIVGDKEGLISHKVADLSEFWKGQKHIKLLDPNLLACKNHIDLLQELADSKAYVDFTQGLDARLLTKENISMINNINLKNIHFAWDYMKESERVVAGLERYIQYGKKIGGAFGTVYVLTNFNTTPQEDMYRVLTLRDMGYKPYVMIYDKPHAPSITRKLQGWVNNKIVFNTCGFDEFSNKNRQIAKEKKEEVIKQQIQREV